LFQLDLNKNRPASVRKPLLPAGIALLLCFFLSLAAILSRATWVLGLLTLINGGLLVAQGCERRTLVRGARLLLMQGGVVTGLYLLRYGPGEGLAPGLHISWQLFLVFAPGLILISAATTTAITRTLGRLLPARSAFVLAMSLKFLPLLLAEISTIYEAQLLRGARILPRDLLSLRNWPDLLHCLIAPAVVQALELADNIARAAKVREFGCLPTRSCWPGDEEHAS